MADERPHVDPYWFRPAPTMTAAEAAEKAGLDLKVAKRLWRALGMPDAPDDARVFDERDAEALRICLEIADAGVPLDELVTLARVYGKAASMVADAELHSYQRNLLAPLREQASTQEELRELIQEPTEWLMEASARLFDYARRRHLMRMLELLPAADSEELTVQLGVAFVDLVDFTRISGDLTGVELTGMVEAFEELAVAICADRNARLVKVIGDAVMFVSPRAADLLATATAIVEAVSADDALPVARSGADFGTTVSVGGDYFGVPVNVAARITGFARPGTVVATRRAVEAAGPEAVRAEQIRTRRFKGVGRVELFKVSDVFGSDRH